MLRKLGNILFSEKIPAMICLLACTASILMGFGVGYILFAPGESTVVYAEAGPLYQAEILTPNTEASETLPDAVYYRHIPHEESPSYLYVVSIMDGYVVVYHAPGFGGEIKEVTNTPIGALDSEELDQLIAGIKIYSDEALARVLQDFGS